MEITVDVKQASEPVAIMRLRGSIDASNFVQIVDKAQEIYQNPARNLILDLSDAKRPRRTRVLLPSECKCPIVDACLPSRLQ